MKTIGKYQVIDEIGAGSAGATYRVRDTASEREFALKVLYSSNNSSADLKDQFCRSLAAYAELRHPHIAKMQDVGEADGALYVTTELLYGIDLRRHLEERRALPLEQKLELIAQVADALTVPHSRGMAHGNIKPGNIFIVAGKNAKILDFGSGKWLQSILTSGVKPPALLPNYLAPEQILGQPFDARSDLFAIGLISYQLLTGKYPYEVDSNLIPREIVHSEPPPLRKLDPEIPEEVERLVARALQKDPQQRLQSGAELAVALSDLAQRLRDARTAAAPPVLPAAPTLMPAEKPVPSIVVPASKPAVVAGLDRPAPPGPVVPAATEATTMMAIPRPAAAPPGPAQPPAQAVVKSAASDRPKKPAPSINASQLRRRVIPVAIAGVLAIGIFGTLLSRQNSQASQSKTQAPAVQPNLVTPSAPVLTAPPPAPVPLVEAGQPQPAPPAPAPAAVVDVKPAPELILRGRVRSLWESGKYSQAMTLVDQILAENPQHSEARAWKKKIRAAQDAEAAIK